MCVCVFVCLCVVVVVVVVFYLFFVVFYVRVSRRGGETKCATPKTLFTSISTTINDISGSSTIIGLFLVEV